MIRRICTFWRSGKQKLSLQTMWWWSMMIPHFVNRKDISTNGSASKRALNLVPFLHVPGFRGLPQFIHQQVQDSGYGGVCVYGIRFPRQSETPSDLVNLWVLDNPSLGVQKCDEDLMFPPEVILLNRRVRSETTWNDHLLVVGCGWLSVLDLVNHLNWLVRIGSFMHLQYLHAPLSEIPLEESQYLRWRRVRQSPCCRWSTQSQGYPDEATRAMDAEFWDVNIHGPLGNCTNIWVYYLTLWLIHIDPENKSFLMDTNLPTSIC
jgi:hypothetical protein